MPAEVMDLQEQCGFSRRLQQDCAASQTKSAQESLMRLARQLELKLNVTEPPVGSRWVGQVLVDLRRLRDLYREHLRLAGAPDGLLAELHLAAPHFTPRFERLKQRQRQLSQQLLSLISSLDHPPSGIRSDFSDVRRQVVAILNEFRSVHALENDLILECFDTDLGVGD